MVACRVQSDGGDAIRNTGREIQDRSVFLLALPVHSLLTRYLPVAARSAGPVARTALPLDLTSHLGGEGQVFGEGYPGEIRGTLLVSLSYVAVVDLEEDDSVYVSHVTHLFCYSPPFLLDKYCVVRI